MTHDSINDLAVDAKDGGLWIGARRVYFITATIGSYHYGPDEGVPGPVGPLCAAREGGVWFSPQPGQVALLVADELQTWEFGPNRMTTLAISWERKIPGNTCPLGSDFRNCSLDRLN